jgi:hypothetical protein
MDTSTLRQAITALMAVASRLNNPTRYIEFFEDAVGALDTDRNFTAYSKVSNTASNMLDDLTDERLRNAVASLALSGYQYCVDYSKGNGRDFAPSRNRIKDLTDSLGGAVPPATALQMLYDYLNPSDTAEPDKITEHEDEVPNQTGPNSQRTGLPLQRSERLFDEAVSLPLARRLSDNLLRWRQVEGEERTNPQVVKFEARLRRLLDTGEEGRRFGDLALIEEEMSVIRTELNLLEIPTRPQDLLERAQLCRNLAAIDFRSADAALYRGSRRSWLVAAFWNSCLAELWATNEEQFVYDVLGYLTAIQAEHRYAIHDEYVLLLLRVSHLICRIASCDLYVPMNFYENFGSIKPWIRYTVGTVLAISGPGRVPPSRLNNDPRFVDDNGQERDRDEFGEILLSQWRAPDEREAACAILLELAGWELIGAGRLLRTILRDLGSEDEYGYEIWWTALNAVTRRARRVKVLRPNPWASASVGKLVTADTHALAVLASDVIHRTFPSLDSNISLNGTSFRQRRVPTFVCSADFGPLGLFKADARERIAREADNFVSYAQRLHPRYRASRCDKSIATISEPDDRIEFVGGLLTSYVFTEREAPRSLNNWFQSDRREVVLELIHELFHEALKPWYQHATLGVFDILSQYELFTQAGLERLTNELATRAALGTDDVPAICWLRDIVNWVTGVLETTDPAIEDQAARLQLCETVRAITHGDLHLDNVMVLGKDGAEYPCLIDFETTGDAHLLRDFGRFIGAVLFRTYDWSGQDADQIRRSISAGAVRDGSAFAHREDDEADEVAKALDVVNEAWSSYVQYWRGGSRPEALELVAALVCSFLPFARYSDTKDRCARLAVDVSNDLVTSLGEGGQSGS